jgi:predicted DCC family thiol-disulfide oxidoreductase YuxK
MRENRVVFYDGGCRLCNWCVRWIIRNDVHGRFSFKALESVESDTVQLFMEGKRYERSSAILQIAVRLRFPWPLLGIFFLVPRFLRDPLYNLVARNRRGWFGENDSNCVI